MSSLKATPGPWMIKQSFGADEFRVMREDRGVNSLRVVRLDRDKAGGFSRADAHLIAAAPELYEALDDLIARCDANQRPGGGSMVPPSARAALAKARGEVQP